MLTAENSFARASAVSESRQAANLLSPSACGIISFEQTESPNPGDQNYFYGVSALSPTDAWAVGVVRTYDGPYETYTAHWNGSQWLRVPAPSPGSYPVLNSVTTLTANNVWAVGTTDGKALILHWDGQQWAQSPAPDFGLDYTYLYGVTAVSANDIWAVGKRTRSIYSTLVLHWNGIEWSEDVSGRIVGFAGYGASFRSVSAHSANDIWAVGSIFGSGGPQTLTAHWNGTTWQRIASPNSGNSDNVLTGVTVTASGTVWAVGYYYGPQARNHTLIMRWSGSQWVIISAPDPDGTGGVMGPVESNSGRGQQTPDGGGGGDPCQGGVCQGNFLMGVAASADNEVWAVGSSDRYSGTQTNTFILHWDGSQWSEVPGSNPSPIFYNRLYSVTAPVPGKAWAVGSYGQDPPIYYSLIEEYDAAYCPTPTPVVPTATATACIGSSEWMRIPSASGPSINRINSMAAVSPEDIWAVGDFGVAGNITHYDGSSWTITPPLFQYGELNDVTVISANDIWAVGTGAGVESAITVHWNGTAWSRIDIGAYGSEDALYGIAGTASNNVWAVGKNADGILFLHWDGTHWHRGPLQIGGMPQRNAPDYSYDFLFDVTASGPNEMWAVGTIYLSGAWHTLVLRWDPQNGWNFVSSPNPGAYANYLRSVKAIAANDVWAVGYARDTYEGSNETLTLHWNGVAWTVVPSPNPVMPDNISGGGVPSSPGAPTGDYDGLMLYGVDGVSSDEVWAVGYNQTTNSVHTIILRWDGTQWAVVQSPNYRTYSQLTSVVAFGHNYAWAAGREGPYWDLGDTLTLRYGPPCDATPLPTNTPVALTNTPMPPTSTHVIPTSTQALPTPTALACGVTLLLDDGFEHAGTLGTTFVSQVVTCQGSFGGCGWAVDADLFHYGAFSVTAPAITDVSEQRLVSTTPIAIPATSLQATLSFWHIEEFVGGDGGVLEVSSDGGATWTDAGPSITQGGYDANLGGFGNPLEGRQGWGDYTHTGWNQVTVDLLPYRGQSLLFRFVLGTNNSTGSPGWHIDDIFVTSRSSCVTGTPATDTATPAIATFTALVATATATTTTITTSTSTAAATETSLASPTALTCSLSFTDMQPDNPFYAQTMCLTCMGIVSGYSDGTFRPNNEVTRGQLAKIVSNTAGFQDQVSGQTFEDVPVSSTFYMYIERMSMRGVIGGYSCGGPNEPCGESNLPYFRPNAETTRGQIAKVVSNAAALNDAPAERFFEDVASTNPFYVYVQRLAQHSMMSGYLCGGEGEPCGSESLPYFRPQNNATRGQLAKIVSNGFYPACTVQP